MKLMPPMRFRFLDEGDRERYGDGWWVHDEAALVRVPARQLIDVERQIGMSLRDMFNRTRLDYTDGTLAAMWLARRLGGVDELFDDFEPLVMLAEWEPVPAADDVDPPAPTSTPSPETSGA